MGADHQGDLISDIMKLSVFRQTQGCIIDGKAISMSVQPTRVHRLALKFDKNGNDQYVAQCQALEDIANVNRKAKRAKEDGNLKAQATDTISLNERTLRIVNGLEIQLLFENLSLIDAVRLIFLDIGVSDMPTRCHIANASQAVQKFRKRNVTLLSY